MIRSARWVVIGLVLGVAALSACLDQLAEDVTDCVILFVAGACRGPESDATLVTIYPGPTPTFIWDHDVADSLIVRHGSVEVWAIRPIHHNSFISSPAVYGSGRAGLVEYVDSVPSLTIGETYTLIIKRSKAGDAVRTFLVTDPVHY